MKTFREVCQWLGSIIIDNPICIETGTMYWCPEGSGNEVHNTTNNILEFISGPKNGTLYSLDIDPEHIEFSKKYNANSDRVNYWCGDSVESLKDLAIGLKRVDLLCFDSKEFDEDHMVNEYNAIKHKLAESHLVLIDDIHNVGSTKWRKMVPHLKELGYEYFEVPTPTGLFVASKGYKIR